MSNGFGIEFDKNELIGLINEVDKQLVKGVVKDTGEYLSNMWEAITYHFYNDYTPVRYERTFNFMYNAGEIEVDNFNNSSTLTVSSANMFPYRYTSMQKTDYILNNVIMEGYHGNAETHTTKPSPSKQFDDIGKSINILFADNLLRMNFKKINIL